MKTGDHVTNGKGRTFQVGQLLGRGLWGKCYLAREEANGSEWVLKVPLGSEDLPAEPPRLAEACREIAREQGRLLEESGNNALVELEERFVAEDGSPAMLMPRYPEIFERRMADVGTMDEVLQALTGAMNALDTLNKVLPVHGSLKPANIMIDEEGSVRLMDPITPTLKRHLTTLARRDGYLGDAYMPPEVKGADGEPNLGVSADTFALAMTLFRASSTSTDPRGPEPLPADGLQKGDVQALKDRLHNRLKDESSNPRFHARLADRAAAIVNRGISVETSPSPPFRFNKLDEFMTRMTEVTSLVHPTIAHVGKLILNRPPAETAFGTDEEVRFSCTVGATQGVEAHEEIAAGLAVFNQESSERIRNLSCSYTVDRHPSGRFRFSFRVTDLPPGQYMVRIAYTIRDSGHEPMTAEEGFQIIAAAGYVPPRTEPERQPISIERPEASQPSENTVTAATMPPGLDTEEREEPDVQVEAEVTPLHAHPEASAHPEPAPKEPEPPAQPEPVIHEPVVHTIDHDPQESTEPVYQGAGSWSELPLPNVAQTELSSVPSPKPESTVEPADRSPIADLIGSLIDKFRSDTYMLFLGAAGLAIIILLITLSLMP
jgi:serine/threonine protein kinase